MGCFVVGFQTRWGGESGPTEELDALSTDNLLLLYWSNCSFPATTLPHPVIHSHPHPASEHRLVNNRTRDPSHSLSPLQKVT